MRSILNRAFAKWDDPLRGSVELVHNADPPLQTQPKRVLSVRRFLDH